MKTDINIDRLVQDVLNNDCPSTLPAKEQKKKLMPFLVLEEDDAYSVTKIIWYGIRKPLAFDHSALVSVV
jgi:hypothetical protein